MAAEDNPNRCFVEDFDTSAAIVALMRNDNPAQWPLARPLDAPVFVKMESDLAGLFKPRTLRNEMNRSGLKALGIVVDAEQREELSAWDRIREFVASADPPFVGIPAAMPGDGLILTNGDGRRLGLWVMPDNKSKGMLEDFLRTLVPDAADQLWQHAVSSVDIARQKFGARCREVHLPKAKLHSWLAFQDPPGERIGTAITMKLLDPNAASAKVFVNWFKRLYAL